jgi:periplasmic protein CpxP/Spy
MRAIVAVLASTLVMGSAFAEGPAKNASRDQEVESHIKALHAELKITPAEESQWENVAQTMRENARELDEAIDRREANVGHATAIDNLNSYADVAQAHADGVRKLATAFSGLYSSMSDDQKKEADEDFGHRAHEARKIAKD